MHDPRMKSRRRTLRWLGAGAWAGSGLPARLVFAAPTAGPADGPRLVVVMLRGALDGLAAVPATGDPAWAALRPSVEAAGGQVAWYLPR